MRIQTTLSHFVVLSPMGSFILKQIASFAYYYPTCIKGNSKNVIFSTSVVLRHSCLTVYALCLPL